MSGAARRRAYRFGRRAEALCLWSLRLRGYRILARRFDARVGEIDIVARRDGLVAFIEVKARADAADPAALVTPRQWRRIARAAGAFLARHDPEGRLSARFDMMLVRRWRVPRHLRDAWRPPFDGG